jgi:hypothetical protein
MIPNGVAATTPVRPSWRNEKLSGDSKIAMIDLLYFEDGELNEGIPGAIRIDPARLRHLTSGYWKAD